MDSMGTGLRKEPVDQSVYSAEPNDVYVDENGKLWRVVWTCNQPTLCLQEIEQQQTLYHDHNLGSPPVMAAPKRTQGAVNGLMFEGFRRIFRPKQVRIEKAEPVTS